MAQGRECLSGSGNLDILRKKESIEVVSMTNCGDCPGLLVPWVTMILGMLNGLGREVDAIHLGTCIKMACEHGNCPMDPDEIKLKLENKFNKPVILGTHTYV